MRWRLYQAVLKMNGRSDTKANEWKAQWNNPYVRNEPFIYLGKIFIFLNHKQCTMKSDFYLSVGRFGFYYIKNICIISYLYVPRPKRQIWGGTTHIYIYHNWSRPMKMWNVAFSCFLLGRWFLFKINSQIYILAF